MRFLVIRNDAPIPSQTRYPYATLRWNNWDDYGYQTTFEVTVHLSNDETIDLGCTKILEKFQVGGKTPFDLRDDGVKIWSLLSDNGLPCICLLSTNANNGI